MKDSGTGQSERHTLLLHCDGRLVAQRPPGVAVGQEAVEVNGRPHPGWVPHLQIEAAAGEDGGEVQFPVEETLGFRHVLDHGEPLVLVNDRLHFAGSGETELDLLHGLQLRPG